MSTTMGWTVIMSWDVEGVGLGLSKVLTVFCFLTGKQ